MRGLQHWARHRSRWLAWAWWKPDMTCGGCGKPWPCRAATVPSWVRESAVGRAVVRPAPPDGPEGGATASAAQEPTQEWPRPPNASYRRGLLGPPTGYRRVY